MTGFPWFGEWLTLSDECERWGHFGMITAFVTGFLICLNIWNVVATKPKGPCDHVFGGIFDGDHWCTKPRGHRGWHQDRDGMSWHTIVSTRAGRR